MMAVAFARQIVRMERAGARGALEKVQILELWLCSALVTLAEQMESLPPSRGSERQEHVHLRAIAAALVMLVLFVQRLKRCLQARAMRDASAPRRTVLTNVAIPAMGLNAGERVPYIDTS